MKWLVVVGGIVLAVLLLALGIANERYHTQTIPLDRIWAYEMPGTRDVRELEPENFGERTTELPSSERFRLLGESLTQQIRDSLGYLRAEEKLQAKSGFAVNGNAAEALRQAHAVLTNKEKPRNTFTAGDEVYIVFFSHLFSSYVHIERAVRRGDTIYVHYRFAPHVTANMSQHFALIPIGKLPVGNYEVDIVQLPMQGEFVTKNNKYVPPDIVRRVICKPFSFSVVENEKNPEKGSLRPRNEPRRKQ